MKTFILIIKKNVISWYWWQMTPPDKNVLLLKPDKNKVPEQWFEAKSFAHAKLISIITFLHAFCGCDTISCFYGQGKNSINKVFQNKPWRYWFGKNVLHARFFEKNFTKKCWKLIVRMYDSNFDGCLNEFRFLIFKKHTSKFSFNLEPLPPTAAAAAHHAFHVYLQVQVWQENNSLHACDWGWISSVSRIKPIYTEDNMLITDSFLKIVFCSCKGNCIKQSCGSRKTLFKMYGNL